MKDKLWFRRKCFGWGWTPCSWEGWLVLAIWVVLFYVSANLIDHEWLKNVVIMVILTGILLLICLKKGEKPKWQWKCKRDEDNK